MLRSTYGRGPSAKALKISLLYKLATLILVAQLLPSSIGTDKCALSVELESVPNIVLIFIDDMGYGDIGQRVLFGDVDFGARYFQQLETV